MAAIACTRAGSSGTWSSRASRACFSFRSPSAAWTKRSSPQKNSTRRQSTASRAGEALSCASTAMPDAATGQRDRRDPTGGLHVDQFGDQPGSRGGRQQLGGRVDDDLGRRSRRGLPASGARRRPCGGRPETVSSRPRPGAAVASSIRRGSVGASGRRLSVRSGRLPGGLASRPVPLLALRAGPLVRLATRVRPLAARRRRRRRRPAGAVPRRCSRAGCGAAATAALGLVGDRERRGDAPPAGPG